MVPDRIKLQLNWLNLRVRLDFIQVNLDKAACMVFFALEMILILTLRVCFGNVDLPQHVPRKGEVILRLLQNARCNNIKRNENQPT